MFADSDILRALIAEGESTAVYAEQYETVIKGKARCYWAQRQSGLIPLDGFILELVAVANISDSGVDADELAETAQLPLELLRRRVVRLIKDGWLEAVPEKDRHRLQTTEKSNNALSAWSRIAVGH